MAFSLGLLTKGLLGTSAVTTATVSIVFKDQIGERINDLFISKDSLNKKIKKLGIEDTNCHFGDDLRDKTCTLDAEKFKKITFVKGGVDATATTSETISVELKIEKLNYRGYSKDFPSALRFTLKNTSTTADLDIGTDSNNKITLKKDIKTDFKIKDGTKLEKAWTLKSLAKKVGLSCAEDTATECSLTNNGTINVWKANDDYITGAKGDTNKKMTVTKESSSYFEGFKFTVTEDISLTGGTKKKETDGIDKLTKEGKSYEIDLKDDNGTKKWFLVEKTAASSVPQESQ